ncbi:acyl-CoA synthetase [Saccharopolyspora sp. HNM0986]|uniref:hypothetical protein n=1 Tax=Saccharopolyspora galaxeae TaxID=2781241 RepID=UPI00190D0821|nr:hypothetical protein [Saccharopolyspora sp. HNM0986]MBK0870244.1 acyl-CoA synthetase [Saccharopolyspora sp. HNM0986]
MTETTAGVISETIGEIPFRTSGSANTPVVWWRTEWQLRAEADVLARELVGEVDQVVNFAPTDHLFGRLTGELLPDRLAVDVLNVGHEPTALPGSAMRKRTLFACLPSSWVVLRRSLSQLRELPASMALHGTGPTVDATDEVVSALADTQFRAVELFGSTETGGIAHRRIPPHRGSRGPWTLLSDVEFAECVSEQERYPEGEWLSVRSPRLARRSDMTDPPAEWQLSDVVTRKGERSFDFGGRGTDLVKINGLRCELSDIADALREAVPGTDAVCVPVHDSVRGEHYEIFYRCERTLSAGQILQAIRSVLEDVVPPRAVHRVCRIPKTSTGKVPVTQLYANIEPCADMGGSCG